MANKVGPAGLIPLPHNLLTLLLNSIGEALVATDRKGRILEPVRHAPIRLRRQRSPRSFHL
jgi:hypothetical protein